MARSASLSKKDVARLIEDGIVCGNRVHITLPAELVRKGESRQLKVYPHDAVEVIMDRVKRISVQSV